jgi:anti-sigma B factor antagonist
MTNAIESCADRAGRERPLAAQLRHMSLSVEPTPAGVTILVGGEVDAAEAFALIVAVNRALCDGAKSLVVDCAQVDFIDSVGLNALVEGRRRAIARGSSLTIHRPSPHVSRMLRLTGLEHTLTPEAATVPLSSHRPRSATRFSR